MTAHTRRQTQCAIASAILADINKGADNMKQIFKRRFDTSRRRRDTHRPMALLAAAVLVMATAGCCSSGGGGDADGAANGGASALEPSAQTGTPYGVHGKLHVQGAYLYDEHGNKMQLYGMSTHGLTFGQDFTRYINQDAMYTLVNDWNTNCIRLALYPTQWGGYTTGGNKQSLKKIVSDGIDYATKAGMYVLVDWHIHGESPAPVKDAAKEFLGYISSKYKNYGNVLYEICNEPKDSPWESVIKPYAQEIIPVIRDGAPDAVVVVGTNTWSQDIDEAARSPLSFDNVMYTFHFYADTHKDAFRTRVENAIKGGFPVFITEYGTCDASGNGGYNEAETNQWFALIKKYNISHINWSLSAKAETASALKSSCSKTSGWADSDLTDSGRQVVQHYRTLTK